MDAGEQTLAFGTVRLFRRNEPKTDLKFFLNIFLQRCNNVNKALLKCEIGVADIIGGRHDLIIKVSWKPIKLERLLALHEFTLARFVQAFSAETAALIIAGETKGRLNSKIFRGMPPLMQQSVLRANPNYILF